MIYPKGLDHNDMARREISSLGSKREVPNKGNSVYQALNFLTYGLPDSIQKSTELTKQRGEQIQQKTKSGNIMGAIGQTINPADMFSAASPEVAPAAATAATYVGVPLLLKSLLPYLTYGGLNRLLEKTTQQDSTAAAGRDIQSTITDTLTGPGRNQLGNVRSEVKPIVNDILNKRMQGGFSNTQPYTAHDIYQTAQNVGAESKYQPGEVESVRQALTGLVKDIVPGAENLYSKISTLSQIPQVTNKIPLLGNFVSKYVSARDPWTWPFMVSGAIKGGQSVLNRFSK